MHEPNPDISSEYCTWIILSPVRKLLYLLSYLDRVPWPHYSDDIKFFLLPKLAYMKCVEIWGKTIFSAVYSPLTRYQALFTYVGQRLEHYVHVLYIYKMNETAFHI